MNRIFSYSELVENVMIEGVFLPMSLELWKDFYGNFSDDVFRVDEIVACFEASKTKTTT
jgi:hypothetical protein